MVKLESMLFPTDLSGCSRSILDYAADFSKIGVKKASILFVINLTKVSTVAGGFDIDKYIEEESKAADEKLPYFVESLEKAGIETKVIEPYPTGDPVAEILNHSEDHDFVTMGSHGVGAFKELLLGSVSEGVVRKSRIPTFVFKFKIERKGEEVNCIKQTPNITDRILVAYDFSKHSDMALEYAKYISSKVGSELHIVHAKEPEHEEKDLDWLVDELKESGFNVRGYLRAGSPHKVILRVSDEIGASSIFMGSRGLGAVESILLGSTSDSVIRRSKIPVFVCREEKDED